MAKVLSHNTRTRREPKHIVTKAVNRNRGGGHASNGSPQITRPCDRKFAMKQSGSTVADSEMLLKLDIVGAW